MVMHAVLLAFNLHVSEAINGDCKSSMAMCPESIGSRAPADEVFVYHARRMGQHYWKSCLLRYLAGMVWLNHMLI